MRRTEEILYFVGSGNWQLGVWDGNFIFYSGLDVLNSKKKWFLTQTFFTRQDLGAGDGRENREISETKQYKIINQSSTPTVKFDYSMCAEYRSLGRVFDEVTSNL